MKWKYAVKAISLFTLSAFISACGSDDPISREQSKPNTERDSPKGELATLSLQGDWSDEARALSLELKNGIPQFKFESQKEYPIKLYIKKLAQNDITTVNAKAVYSVLENGKRHFQIQARNFSLQGAGQAFTSGSEDWYVCGVIGEAPASTAEQKVMSPITEERKIPMGFPWTKLTISQNGLGEHRQLRFNLIGNLLRVGLRNNIISAVEVSEIKLKSQGIAFAGAFSPESVTDANLTGGDYMSFKSSTRDQEFKISPLTTNGESIRVGSGQEHMFAEAFIWTYPVDKSGGIQAQMRVLTRPRGMTAAEFAKSGLPDKEKKHSRPTLCLRH